MRFLTPIHGFCMALADSVPGVSGGTVAFIMGFYDRFINALHDLFGRDGAARKAALGYLVKLGAGWGIGMALCVSLLADLFSVHIYFMSSLFLGLTVASVPFVALAEKEALRRWQFAPFALLGGALVVSLTALRASSGLLTVDMAHLQLMDAAYLFLAGAVAITAMVLPGISGSSILLIAGVYLPVIQAIRQVLHLDLQVLPGLIALGLGVIAGVALSIRGIRAALRKYRSAMIWFILGLMLGSLYAIVMGPAGLQMPQSPVGSDTFRPLAFLLGVGLLVGLELLRRRMERGVAIGEAAYYIGMRRRSR